MKQNFAPGSYGAHEALHTADMLMDLVDMRLMQHPTVAGRSEWLALATAAHRQLFDLYQAIGAEHLADENPARHSRWREARAMALKNLQEMSDEEDAAITADAEADPDNSPADDLMRRRGRIR